MKEVFQQLLVGQQLILVSMNSTAVDRFCLVSVSVGRGGELHREPAFDGFIFIFHEINTNVPLSTSSAHVGKKNC